MQNFPKELLDGYKNFMSHSYARKHRQYVALAEKGQKPATMIIGCCDSRAAPETIFDCGPGELFVLRNVANLVPPFAPDGGQHGTSAAIEFAVQALKVQNIVVMGHARCGGINAALNPMENPLAPGDFIGKWISLLDPVVEHFKDNSALTDQEERQTAFERISVGNSIKNLRSFPYIAELEQQNKIRIHGAWFDIKSGELWIMDQASGEFLRP